MGDNPLTKLDKNIRLHNTDLFKIVQPKTMEVDSVEVMGTKVSLGNQKYIIVYASKVAVTGTNFSMKPNFGDRGLLSRGSVIQQHFGDVIFGEELYANEVTTGLADQGTKVFKYLYEKIKNDPIVASYTGSSVAFRDGTDRFIRRIQLNTLSRYATLFGKFLSLLNASGTLEHCKDVQERFTVDCYQSTELLAEDITKFIKDQCWHYFVSSINPFGFIQFQDKQLLVI